ncbi:hypothetical protein K469DRAFT_748847 [Zopfia rhizophila CBS 207.26]|uniref:Beta/gamma crystallin 'Greek key' domain-containing protein n=1 Tax=Zopfia rhizophila CBS 207.26 TaxID=1314779 RepID=A0A6A6E6N1_9PEZI|nr:hypothetical protein K469DRAFT_748847 [Zopfia rhizophila CBS 207.26]
MHTKYVFTILTTLTVATFGTPDATSKRQTFTVEAFEHTGYTGQSRKYEATSGVCQDTGDLNDSISSIKTGGHACTLYRDYSCQGASFGIAGDVPSLQGVFNDQMSSFRCS